MNVKVVALAAAVLGIGVCAALPGTAHAQMSGPTGPGGSGPLYPVLAAWSYASVETPAFSNSSVDWEAVFSTNNVTADESATETGMQFGLANSPSSPSVDWDLHFWYQIINDGSTGGTSLVYSDIAAYGFEGGTDDHGNTGSASSTISFMRARLLEAQAGHSRTTNSLHTIPRSYPHLI